MPSGIATGLAEGSEAFLSNFRQARLMKHQQKLMENEPILRAMQSVLADDTTPYSIKADILDHIGNLATDNKMKIPLSEQTGLRKLLREKVITDEGQSEIKPQAAIAGTTPTSKTSAETSSPNEGQVLPMRGTQSTNAVEGRDYIAPTSSISRGDMSPLEYKARIQAKYQKDLEETRNAADIEKIKQTYQLQHDILNKGGFLTKTFEGTNNVDNEHGKKGDYIIGFTNGEDTKFINLGQVTPAAVLRAQITAGGSGANSKLGQLTRANTIIQEYSLDPSSHTYAEFISAKGLVDDFETTGRLKDSTINANNSRAAGTGPPPSPQQVITNDREERQKIATFKVNINSAKRQTIEAENDSKTKTEQANQFWNKTIQPIKDKIEGFFKDKGLDPNNPGASGDVSYLEDSTFKGLSSELERQTAIYEKLSSAAGDATSKHKSLLETQKNAEDILNDYTSSNPTKQNKYPQAVMNLIEQVRQGKNKDKVVGMSDEDIYQQLVNAGKITQ